MRLLGKSLLCVAGSLLTLVGPVNMLAQSGQSIEDPSVATTGQSVASVELPDSPGTVQSQANASSQVSGAQGSAPQSSSAQSSSAPPAPQAETQTKQSKPDRPVGAAAAEAPMVSGTTAAQPAGVAIAPAKQRRVRTLVLKVGAIIGASVAVGTIIALSEATPSKPPGAH